MDEPIEKMVDEESSTTVKLPVFKGEESQYQMWLKRFRAFARVKGFNEALEKSNDLSGSEAVWKAANKTSNEYKHGVKNNVGMAQLTLALDDPLLMGLISKAETSDWPGGVAWKVMQALSEKYSPKDRISRIEMRRRLNCVKMTKKENPDTLFLQIAMIIFPLNFILNLKYHISQFTSRNIKTAEILIL